MRITNQQLKQIIKEELHSLISEQDGVDFVGMLDNQYDDRDLYQRMILANDSGMLDQPEEAINKFLDDYMEAIDKLESVGGLNNKSNWTDEEKTMVYNLEMDYYRNTSIRMLRNVGLLD